MKKLIFIAIIVLLISSGFTATILFAADTINVTVNNQRVNFADQAPTIVDGRTLVPVRGVFEMLGFEVNWDADTQTVTLSDDDNIVNITIGNTTFVTNNTSYTLDVPAQIINGRTMLPIAAVLRSVGYDVDWDGDTATVLIIYDVDITEPVEDDVDPGAPATVDPTPAITEPVVEEPTANACPFAQHFDMQQVRDILGVDFTIQEQAGTARWGGDQFRWFFLTVYGEVDISRFVSNSDSGIGGHTERGDVFIMQWADRWYLYIDTGHPGSRTRIYAMFPLFANANNIDISEFAQYFDIDNLKELIGVDFEVRNRIDPRGNGQDFWYHLVLEQPLSSSQRRDLVEMRDTRISRNQLRTQLGDMLIAPRGGQWFLHIDMGANTGIVRNYALIALN